MKPGGWLGEEAVFVSCNVPRPDVDDDLWSNCIWVERRKIHDYYLVSSSEKNLETWVGASAGHVGGLGPEHLRSMIGIWVMKKAEYSKSSLRVHMGEFVDAI